VLRAAARLAYGPESHAKFKLANRLINSMTDTADPRTMSSLSLDAAAAASHIPARGLLTVLQSDSCFVVKQASSSSGSYSVRLNAKALLEKGRSCTKAGVLAEELPDPEGYIDDQHPIRPGGCHRQNKVGFQAAHLSRATARATCAQYTPCCAPHVPTGAGVWDLRLRFPGLSLRPASA
jgi:hypothetical protein